MRVLLLLRGGGSTGEAGRDWASATSPHRGPSIVEPVCTVPAEKLGAAWSGPVQTNIKLREQGLTRRFRVKHHKGRSLDAGAQ